MARIDAFLHQIELLNEIEFPYLDSNQALQIIEEHIKEQRNDVADSLMEGESLKSRCSISTIELNKFHRFLGYIVKSAEPLNSFEIYFSFRRLAKSIFGKDIHLIISSEWEYYSPIHFNRPLELIDFVFIGLPVSESSNSLIVPLAGHELGHSIWTSENFDSKSFRDKYRPVVQSHAEKIIDIADQRKLSFMVDVTLSKCAEYFCDFIGIGLFGESYILAFSYLLAPKISKKFNRSHPNAGDRAIGLKKAADAFGYEVPHGIENLFKTYTVDSEPEDYLEQTENISFDLIEQIIKDVKILLDSKGVLYKPSELMSDIIDELLSMVPSSKANSLGDLTNAAWHVYLKEEKWENIKSEDKKDLLNELTFKSYEILEIKQRLTNDS